MGCIIYLIVTWILLRKDLHQRFFFLEIVEECPNFKKNFISVILLVNYFRKVREKIKLDKISFQQKKSLFSINIFVESFFFFLENIRAKKYSQKKKVINS